MFKSIGYKCGYLLKRRKVFVVLGMLKLNLSRNSLVVLDLGSKRFLKKPINPTFQEINLWLKFSVALKIECYNDAYNHLLYLFGYVIRLKILQLRPLIQDFIWYKIGNGSSISVWHDRWCDLSPLSNMISYRDVYMEGFNQNTTFDVLLSNGQLNWPNEWYVKYPLLNTIVSPTISPGTCDKLEWHDIDGLVKPFFVHTVWNSIRPRSAMVWLKVKGLVGLPSSNPSIDSIIHDIIPFSRRKTSKSIIAKLVVAATSYFIWQERNKCLRSQKDLLIKWLIALSIRWFFPIGVIVNVIGLVYRVACDSKTWKLSKQGSRSAGIHLVIGWLILLRLAVTTVGFVYMVNTVNED
uniref:Reverse transcriptase zinc-binding domain-containing protein n=1 Tax=Tanacetum cinerariifolium TaxID=118510 RepID=A0A6L2NX53_TANCI|nr:hypothetical protein [Tanacetum cinerariifolium]